MYRMCVWVGGRHDALLFQVYSQVGHRFLRSFAGEHPAWPACFRRFHAKAAEGTGSENVTEDMF